MKRLLNNPSFTFKINFFLIFIGISIFSCGPSEKEKLEIAIKESKKREQKRIAAEDSTFKANRPSNILKDNDELLKRGITSVTICQPIKDACTIWQYGNRFYTQNVQYSIQNERIGHFLHIIDNNAKIDYGYSTNPDSVNYYRVVFLQDRESRGSVPYLIEGFVNIKDVKIYESN